MNKFPDRTILNILIPWLLNKQKELNTYRVSTKEIKTTFKLNDTDYQNLYYWFFEINIWKPIGNEWFELTNFLEEFDNRFGIHISQLDFNILLDFSRERDVMNLVQMAAMTYISNPEQTPSIVLKALLTFGDKTTEGRLIEAVGIPWFKIIAMINSDPDSIYQIDPFKWEEIIAGAYKTAGFDEVILTPRSGDKGRDVIATKNGIGSIRIVDQVKAYNPDHLVTANDVRALAGVISMERNVSKGVITTTSDFAPRVRDDELIKSLMPYRLELRSKNELLPWLEKLAIK